MPVAELEELRAYSARLRLYSTEELEDIYFHIDILGEPVRYQMLLRELQSRRMQLAPSQPAPRSFDLAGWLRARPFAARHPVLQAAILSILLFVCTTLVTLALWLPFWLFAVPLRFTGLQTALVYFACAPVPPILGAAIGGRLGGRGAYGVCVLLGVAAAMVAFNATGTPAVIVRAIVEPQGVRGGGFGW